MTPPTHPADPILTPEERAVAARLATLGGADGPSPALDARILAAARAAVAVTASPARIERRPRSMRRWPSALGVAASLVIAVGLAWQLGAVFELPPLLHREVRVEAPAADAAASPSNTEDELSPDVLARAQPVPRPGAGPPVAPSPPPPAVAAGPARRSGPSLAARRATAPGPAAMPRAEPPREFVDEGLANAKAASPAAAAPAAPAAFPASGAGQATRQVEERASSQAMVQPTQDSRDRPAAAPELDRTTVSGSRMQRPAPPAAAAAGASADDSRLGVVAWIRHIRSLRDDGHPDAARASLQRFIAAHPGMRLPRDLKPLLPRD